MQFLRDLSSIIGAEGFRTLAVSEQGHGRSSPKQERFLAALRDNLYASDAEAARDLYGAEATDQRYRTLKSRIRELLLNTILIADTKALAKHVSAELQCSRDIVVIRYLLTLGRRDAAVGLLRKTLKRAQKLHLSQIAITCLDLLRHDAHLAGNERDFEKLDQELKHTCKVLEVELLSKEYLQRIQINFVTTMTVRPVMASEAREYVAELEELLEHYDTFTIRKNYFRLKALSFQVADRNRETLAVCEAAQHYLLTHKEFYTRALYAMWEQKKLTCYFSLRRYDDAEQSAMRCLELLKSKRANFLFPHTIRFLICMHRLKFDEALSIYRQVTRDPRFGSIRRHEGLRWAVFGAYLYYVFLSKWKGENSAEQELFVQEFSYDDYVLSIAQVPVSDRALNNAILALRVMFFLLQFEKRHIINLGQAFRSYRSKHLRKAENKRSKNFFRMLEILVDKELDCDAIAADPEIRELHNQLYKGARQYRAGDNDEAGQEDGNSRETEGNDVQVDGFEVIPYELLWDRILQHHLREIR